MLIAGWSRGTVLASRARSITYVENADSPQLRHVRFCGTLVFERGVMRVRGRSWLRRDFHLLEKRSKYHKSDVGFSEWHRLCRTKIIE